MKKTAILLSGILALTGCATEHSRTVEPIKSDAAKTPYSGAKYQIAVGKFDNRSSFMRGIFSDGVDQLGSQAKTILITHLQQAGRFSIMDRDNTIEAAKEAGLLKKTQNIKGAEYLVIGDVTEFGRKEVGDQQLFGILGRGKSQVAYAKVNLNIVNVETSEVIYSVQGAGEYSLNNREIVGFGGTASYDATLNGKVLDLAIREAVSNLANGIDTGAWRPAK